jgi:glyoxylate/hydroxypyruvate reductase A
VEADILAALDSGQLAGAALDVFEVEPLPEDSPIWSHPKITLTPHIASMTLPQSSAVHVFDNIQRFRSGRPLTHVADMARGY